MAGPSGNFIPVNESSAYSMSQAQGHQRRGNFCRMVCNPKSNGSEKDLGKTTVETISQECLCILQSAAPKV